MYVCMYVCNKNANANACDESMVLDVVRRWQGDCESMRLRPGDEAWLAGGTARQLAYRPGACARRPGWARKRSLKFKHCTSNVCILTQ